MKVTITYGDLEKALFVAFSKALEETADFLEKEFNERLMIQFYSLSKLRQMDHPYARRHYSFGRIPPTSLEKYALSLKFRKGYKGVPLSMINRQTGQLEDSLKTEIKVSYAGLSYARVFVDTTKVPYAPYVFWGTHKLIPRPIHLLVKAESERETIYTFKRVFGYNFYKEAKKLKKKVIKSTKK